MSLFLLTVFGLLLGAGIKGKMEKAGLEPRFNWAVGRELWEVGRPVWLACPPRLRLTITQGLIPRRRSEEIGVGMRNLFGGRGGGRRDEYNSVPDSVPG